jgi:4-amino-4-deoxy-L-arabinose transferase-like glycosyltransferase
MTATTDKRFSVRAGGLAAILDYAVSTHGRAIAVLAITGLLAFLPGFFQIPPTDRDEARFAQATKQMLETGEYVDIRFQDEVRYKKPVGIYWLQAAAVKAGEWVGVPDARTTIWLYRLPLLLTYWTALAFVSRRAATLAGMMMATSVLLGVEARLAKTDAMLLLTVVAAMGAMARAYLGDRRPLQGGLARWTIPAIFWTAMAGGIMLKGPLIVMIVGLAAAALAIADRSARWMVALRPIPGLIWVCVLALPWFIAIMSRAGNNFLAESVGHDLLAKMFSGQETHGAPPGLYFALFWVTFWPGATLAGMAAPAVWAARREKGARYLLAWIVPSWIVFELVITKLPHYVLPLYPAIAILIAGVADQHLLTRKRWVLHGAAWWFVLPVVASVVAIGGLIGPGHELGLLAWPFATAAIVFGLWAWRLLPADGAERSLLRAMAASITLAVAVHGVVFPQLTVGFPSATLARMLQESGCKRPLVAAAGYQEPSLVFLAGTDTKLVDGSDAADFLRGGECRFAVVEQRYERAFLRRAEIAGIRYAAPQRIDGYNYSNGRAVSLGVYRSQAAP